MTIKIAINGYGRIGRNILRALYEGQYRSNNGRSDIEVVAINDLGDVETNVHLTRYDSVHGRFPGTVEATAEAMLVDGDRIRVLDERDPA
jgi:glyceraldehyde 3-phosphate dehydrogenase